MKTEWVLSQEAFDAFLAWLDRDRDRAGEKYEQIRRELIKDFVYRECVDPEALADEAINHVIRKLPEIEGTCAGDPASYVYAVAQGLLRIWRKGAKPILPLNETKRQSGDKRAWKLMGQLDVESRELSLNYYQQERLQ